MRLLLLVLLGACAARSGRTVDSPALPARAGPQVVVLEGDDIGGRRSAFLHVPSVSGPLPVLLAFHGGYGNNGREMAARWRHVSHQPVLLVFPDGQTERRDLPGWTGVGRPAPNDDEWVDVRFVERLLDRLAELYPVDRSRVYVAGFSNGAFLTWNLVCAMPERLAGFATVAKPLPRALTERCEVSEPLPWIAFQGTADRLATWEEKPHTLSFEQTVAWWLARQGCDGSAVGETRRPDANGTRVRRAIYACASPVQTFVVEGGVHVWPRRGAAPRRGVTEELDATEEILQFFVEHAGL